MTNHSFLVPDYYPNFRCKGGSCRSNCCQGWPVTISETDYFKLIGLDCSAELRRRLDDALNLLDHPTPERYAEISHNWLGLCPLQASNGYCLLQTECGEEALSSTCRYYPRAIHSEYDYECCCSCSCEAVVEILLRHNEPLRMGREELCLMLPLYDARLPRDLTDRDVRERDHAISILQDRALPFSSRIERITGEQSGFDSSLDHKSSAAALREANRLVNELFSDYDEVADVCRCANRNVGTDLEKWNASEQRFHDLLPQEESFFENIMINHLLYSGYPFSEFHLSLQDEQLALAVDYAVLRYLLISSIDQDATLDQIVDHCALCFRIIEHTNFEQRAVAFIKAESLTQKQLDDIIEL